MIPEKAAVLVKITGMEKSVIFWSFHPSVLRRIRKLMPEVPAGLLTGESWMAWGNTFLGRRLSPDLIHPYYTKTTRALIEKAHRDGRRVNTWTVDDPREIFRLVLDGWMGSLSMTLCWRCVFGMGYDPGRMVGRGTRQAEGKVLRTPLLYDEEAEIYLKLENLQTTGSFKIRGALNRVLTLTGEERDGIVTASAGNHGLGVAQAVGMVGGKAIIYVSDHAVPEKVNAIRSAGGEI